MTRTTRGKALASTRAGLGLLLLAAAFPAAAAAHHQPLAPDLIADAPRVPTLVEDTDAGYGTAPAGRRLLRLEASFRNAGVGPLELVGTTPVSSAMTTVEQRYKTSAAATTWIAEPSPARLGYEAIAGHDRWNAAQLAEYSLVDAAGADVAPVQPVGFCLEDSQRVSGFSSRYYGVSGGTAPSCQRGNPTAASLRMGLSPGWRDTYASQLPFQWVDVSDTLPGRYRLRVKVDPANVVHESDETNVPAETAVTIPGYVPVGQSVGGTLGQALSLTLATTVAGRPLRAPTFSLTRLPAHGRILDAAGAPLAAGQSFDNPAIRYVPEAVRPPTDSLEFSVRETGSRFPLSAPRATVALQAGTRPLVTLSGMRDVLIGTTLQLAPRVDAADPHQVAWTASSGEVDPGGLYHAPSAVPEGGRVTVTARVPGSDPASVSFAIIDVPYVRPSPGPVASSGTPSAAPRKAAAAVPTLSVRTTLAGRSVSAAVLSRFDGRVRVKLMAGKRKVSSCLARTRAKRSSVCRLSTRRVPVARLRVVASLRRENGALVVRTMRLAAKATRTR